MRYTSAFLAIIGSLLATTASAQVPQCTVPNTLVNGQVADATDVMENFNAVAACVESARGDTVTHQGTPTTGAIAVFASPTGITGGNLTGDVTTSGSTATQLATSGVTPGTYHNATVTVDAKGRVTFATSGASGTGTGGGIDTIGEHSGVLGRATNPGVNNYLSKLLVVPKATTLNAIAFHTQAATPTAKYRVFVYSATPSRGTGVLLGQASEVTGITAGYNEVPLASSIPLSKGDMIWIGINASTAAVAQISTHDGGLAGFAANGATTNLANPGPTFTVHGNTTNSYAIWGIVTN